MMINMKKEYVIKVFKVLLGLVLFGIIGFVALICFYIYMIYGIHSSDEGTRSVACTYDPKQKQYTSIEITTIINQERVKTKGQESDCDLHLKYE